METIFSYSVRTIECDHCGAPITGALAGGEQQCEYCGAQVTIRARPTEHREQTRLDEAAWIAGLRAQLRGYNAEQSFMRRPEGLEAFTAMLANPAARQAGQEAYRQEWDKTRRRLEGAPDDAAAQLHLFRVALRLADDYVNSDEQSRARAVLETAIDHLSDPDQRDVLRCRLARAALKLKDDEAAAAWLAEVNPRPMRIEVDGERRLAGAELALARGAFAEALEHLGQAPGQVPLVVCGELGLPGVLRAHALEGLGRHEAAMWQIGAASITAGVAETLALFDAHPGPASAFAAEAAAKAAQKRRRTGRITVAIFAAIVMLPVLNANLTPACQATCSSGSVGAVLACLQDNAEVKAALGDGISWALGCNCRDNGNQGCESVKARLPVQGSKGGGVFVFSGVKQKGAWGFNGVLELDRGGSIQVDCPHD